MKKFLSLFLVLCMLLSSVMLLASCTDTGKDDGTGTGTGTGTGSGSNNEDTTEETPKTPEEILNDSLGVYLGSFFKDESGFADVLDKAADKGKYTLSFASDELMGGELTKISETIYADAANNLFVSETGAVYNGEALTAFIYASDKGIAFASEALFGDATALLFDPKTFGDKFENSAIADMLGFNDPESDAGAFLEMYKELMESGNLNVDQSPEKAEEYLKGLLELIDKNIGTEKIDDKDYIVASYSVNNENIKKILEYIFDIAIEELKKTELPEGVEISEIEAQLDAMLTELDARMDAAVEIKVYADAATGAIYKVTLDGDITVTQTIYEGIPEGSTEVPEPETVEVKTEIDAELLFTDKAISLSGAVKAGEEEVTLDVVLEKEVKDGDVTYTFSVEVGSDSVTVKLMTLTYKLAKDGAITIHVKLPEELVTAEGPQNIYLNGKLDIDENKAELTFTSLQIGEDTIEFELKFAAEVADKLPEFPENAEDIVDITAERWEEIITKAEESILVEILGSIIPSEPDEPEIDMELYMEGYSVGYGEGYVAGMADVEAGNEITLPATDADRYEADSYYMGYVDGYEVGYYEAFYGIEY